jgi:hypothetical protein
VSLPADSAHATATNPKNKTASTCLAQGYEWDDVKGCADKTCTYQGKTYLPGQMVLKEDVYRCDGFTGNWVPVEHTPPHPSGPTAPRAGTASR